MSLKKREATPSELSGIKCENLSEPIFFVDPIRLLMRPSEKGQL